MKETGLTIVFLFFLFILSFVSIKAQTLNWQSTYPYIYVYDMLCDGDSTLYVTGSEGYPYFYRSTDLGSTWTRIGNGNFNIRSLAMDSSGVLWAGNTANGGIYNSTDQGNTWSQSLYSNDLISFLNVSKNNWIWAGSTVGKIIFSSDHGVSWASDSVSSGTISCMGSNSQNDIFAGSWDGKVYRTTDSGTTWETVYNIGPLGIWGMVIDSSDIIYAYKWDKCLVSSDNGNTWIEIPGPQLEGLFLDPFENIYAGLGYRTLDNCSTWTYVGPAVGIPNCYCFFDSLVFAGTSQGIFLYDPTYHPHVDKTFYPLDVGNQWQYNSECDGNFTGNKINTITRDSMIDGKKYYFIQGNINDWVRYDKLLDRFQLRWDDSDYTVMDYTLNEGVEFEQMAYNSHWTRIARIIEPININIFDTIFTSRGYYWGGMLYNQAHWIYHSEELGETQDHSFHSGPGGQNSNCFTKLIRAIIYDSTGPKYYSDGVKPEIIFEPQPVIHNFSLNWDFLVDHDYSGFGNYWNENFIDTVLMYSYYSNGDSTRNNLPVEGINEPNTIDYNITYQLDSTLMKNSFNFYYKIYAVDKGIVPESSTKPNSGYYELSYDPNPVSVKDKDTPIAFELQQNFPNPFNNSSVIIYSIPKPSQVLIKIFNTLGEEVATLINEEESTGNYEVEVNVNNLPSGIYFYRIQAGSFIETKKMILLK